MPFDLAELVGVKFIVFLRAAGSNVELVARAAGFDVDLAARAVDVDLAARAVDVALAAWAGSGFAAGLSAAGSDAGAVGSWAGPAGFAAARAGPAVRLKVRIKLSAVTVILFLSFVVFIVIPLFYKSYVHYILLIWFGQWSLE